jgi:hypothetical protein
MMSLNSVHLPELECRGILEKAWDSKSPGVMREEYSGENLGVEVR